MNLREFLENSQTLAIQQADARRQEEVKKWESIADELAFVLDSLIDNRDNIRNWLRAHDALKKYESEKR